MWKLISLCFGAEWYLHVWFCTLSLKGGKLCAPFQLRFHTVTFLTKKPVSLRCQDLSPRDASYWSTFLYFLPLNVSPKQAEKTVELSSAPPIYWQALILPSRHFPVCPPPIQVPGHIAPPPPTHPHHVRFHSATYLSGHRPSACRLPLLPHISPSRTQCFFLRPTSVQGFSESGDRGGFLWSGAVTRPDRRRWAECLGPTV